jgi:hypothetical protein
MNLRDARRPIASQDADSNDVSVFGREYQTPDGATIIPVSKPVGVFVIKDGAPIWSPAADGTRIALMGIIVGLVATSLVGIAMVRRPPWPELWGDVSKRH